MNCLGDELSWISCQWISCDVVSCLANRLVGKLAEDKLNILKSKPLPIFAAVLRTQLPAQLRTVVRHLPERPQGRDVGS